MGLHNQKPIKGNLHPQDAKWKPGNSDVIANLCWKPCYDLILQLRCPHWFSWRVFYTVRTIVLNMKTQTRLEKKTRFMDVDSTGGPWTYLGKHRANRCPAGRQKVMKQKELAYSWKQVYTSLGAFMFSNMHNTHTQHQYKIHHAISCFKYAKSKNTPPFFDAAIWQ